ncbi:hypothetical protein N481_07510 [Pseudoalteromonas luteoviolacea S4047-1]|uniref:Uncharacterized protein n=1 Tax=Pseudoalteromonas luteoviolacea S4054 TaxID=1129367 RepID=A0A0F6ADF8_9GAMM|nr:hypothetical protein S4054_10600 [Pseudoalteromonas luteoviolacea]KKE84203.1 hypothetical protein N479_09905 [Pseudoalteromonas luteoviolacea S4054]KZN76192.1 hypothetical protein N481_07510 [Pseudoalteromonas luteoviolacea S4047-1]
MILFYLPKHHARDRVVSISQKEIKKVNNNKKVKDLKLVVAGTNSGGDRGGPPTECFLTNKELQKVAGGGNCHQGGPPHNHQ